MPDDIYAQAEERLKQAADLVVQRIADEEAPPSVENLAALALQLAQIQQGLQALQALKKGTPKRPPKAVPPHSVGRESPWTR